MIGTQLLSTHRLGRVVFQEKGERNYHIFYQVLFGIDSPEELARLQLGDFRQRPEEVCYLNQSGCMHIEDVDDAQDYGLVVAALKQVNFSADDIGSLNSVVAGILHMVLTDRPTLFFILPPPVSCSNPSPDNNIHTIPHHTNFTSRLPPLHVWCRLVWCQGNIFFEENVDNTDACVVGESSRVHVALCSQLLGLEPTLLTRVSGDHGGGGRRGVSGGGGEILYSHIGFGLCVFGVFVMTWRDMT